jgi:hypothetical protein
MWHIWVLGDIFEGFRGGNVKKRDNLYDLSKCETIVLKCIFKTRDGGMECIDQTQ